MMSGIPHDMRQTALLSLAGHLVLLAALAIVPLLKLPPKGTMAYQVSLVSLPAMPSPSVQPAPAPFKRELVREAAVPPSLPPPTPAPSPVAAIRVPVAPAKPASVLPARQSKSQEPAANSLKENLARIPLPQTLPRPDMTGKAAPAAPDALPEYRRPAFSSEPVKPQATVTVSSAKPEPALSKGPVDGELREILKKGEERLRLSTAVPAAKPVDSGSSPSPTPRTSEEINKLLGRLSVPAPISQSVKPPTPPIVRDEVAPSQAKTARVSLSEQIKHMLPPVPAEKERLPLPKKEPAPAIAAAVPGSLSMSRSAALEPCPKQAKEYCLKLQEAISRAWNADTIPGVRQVLESAGDSAATVRIVIQPNGEIRDVNVSRSSGNEPYDRAVLSVLREFKHAPPLPEELKGEPFIAFTSFTYAKKQAS